MLLHNFNSIVGLAPESLLAKLTSKLQGLGYVPKRGNDFLFAPGSIPVLLIAHVDTAHDRGGWDFNNRRYPNKRKPGNRKINIFYDKRKQVLWSPDGLGADDRAGVASILTLLEFSYKPYVLFTDGEESGGIGAYNASIDLDTPPVKLIIELDRRGRGEAVYYDCDNQELENYIIAQGFQTDYGTFTDISILAPAWGVAGVNLSIGFYNEHSTSEYFCLEDARYTISRVKQILANADTLPQFSYKRRKKRENQEWEWWQYSSRYRSNLTIEDGIESLEAEHEIDQCELCGNVTYVIERSIYNETVWMCSSCYQELKMYKSTGREEQ